MSGEKQQAASPGGRGKRLASAVGWGVVLLVILAGIRFMTGMPGSSWSGPLPPLTGEQQRIHDNLRRHVAELAGRIGERNVWRPEAMAAAAAYIRTTLEAVYRDEMGALNEYKRQIPVSPDFSKNRDLPLLYAG